MAFICSYIDRGAGLTGSPWTDVQADVPAIRPHDGNQPPPALPADAQRGDDPPREKDFQMLRPVARRARLLVAGLLAAASLAALLAGPARAGLLVPTATACESQPLSQPFLRWVDPLSYTPAPDGGLEASGAGWTLSKASVVSGNESFYVHGSGDSRSLYLPAGSSATTRAMCVGIGHLATRFFVKSANTSLLSLSGLQVEVLFEDAGGNIRSLVIGTATPSSKWAPTLPMLVIANLLPLLPGDHTPVAFRFTPKGKGSWWIDDVYVDPHRRS
jgi:hypothetical protein